MPLFSSLPGGRRLSARLNDAVRARTDEVLNSRLAEVDARLARVERRMNKLTSRVNAVRSRLDGVQENAVRSVRQLERVAPQLAALEQRVEDRREAADVPLGTPEGLDEARSIVDTVRREHERMRTRLSGVSWYEDRLRKLEEQVAGLGSALEEPADR